MTYFEIYRKVNDHWVLIRTSIETIELARKLIIVARNDAPSFEYKLTQVTKTDLANEGLAAI